MKEKAPLKITAKQSNNWYDDRLLIKLSSNKLSTGQRTRKKKNTKSSRQQPNTDPINPSVGPAKASLYSAKWSRKKNSI